MPIQYLNGIDDNNTNDLVGLLGLDGTDADAQKLYNHLVATRNSLAANPSMVKSIQNPKDMLAMLDYAIEYWNTPKREQALNILEKEEERLIKAGAILNGVDENGQPLQGFFKKVKASIKKGIRFAGDKVKAATISAYPGSAKVFSAAKALRKKKPTSTEIKTEPQIILEQPNTTPNTNTQNSMAENPNPGFVEKYLTPKNIIIAGVAATALFFGYKMLTKKDAPKAIATSTPALSGVRRRRKAAKRKPAAKAPAKTARKRTTRKAKSVKIR